MKKYLASLDVPSHRRYILAMEWMPGDTEAYYCVATGSSEVHSGSVRVDPRVGVTAESADDAVLLATVYGVWPAYRSGDREDLADVSLFRARRARRLAPGERS
jgi:hypothetical protein